MAVEQSTSARKRVYIPPSDQLIDEYAAAVCDHLGATVDPAYLTTDVKRGFAGFLKLIAAIRTEQLNEGNGQP